MRPLALKQTQKPRSDRGKSCHSVSSTSAHHNYGSSSHHGDDDEDNGDSRASTSSPTTYLNSLEPLNYQRYDIPTSSQQDDDLLFERQTDLLNQTQQIHKEVRGGFKSFGKALRGVFGKKKNASNAPSKTPSTKYTSSSIDYIPKSPTSSTSPLTNGYLNSPTSPPPRVPPPSPTQEKASMDITLTLLLITPLDVQFNTPSPPSPLFGHPIPWNLLEAHGDSCLCCIHNRTLIFGLRDKLQYIKDGSKNLRRVSSGVKSSSRWLPVWESATQKPNTLSGVPFDELMQRLSMAWQFKHHPHTLRSPSKPGRANYCTISFHSLEWGKFLLGGPFPERSFSEESSPLTSVLIALEGSFPILAKPLHL
ncbi:hypothetical protein Tco_0422191 [Tanacetum coccineum]